MDLREDKRCFWQRLPELAAQKPLVLYGMGNGADKLLGQLKARGLAPAGIFASDGFVRGQSFAGMRVRTYAEAKEAFGDMAVLVCFGTEKPEVIETIARIAAEQELYAPHLPLFGSQLADETLAAAYETALRAAAGVWADGESAAVYRGYLRYMWTGRINYLQSVSSRREAAWDLLGLREDECYLDLGAYDGDTVLQFCQLAHGKWRQIWALEPDPHNFAKLEANLARLANCRAFRLAAGGRGGQRSFANLAGRCSAFTDTPEQPGAGRIAQVEAISLDELWQSRLEWAPTLIKMDVEGAEEETLRGAGRLLREHKPRLVVAAYHRTEDIFRLPLLIKELNPEYRLYLRHHPYIPGWETNIYAV